MAKIFNEAVRALWGTLNLLFVLKASENDVQNAMWFAIFCWSSGSSRTCCHFPSLTQAGTSTENDRYPVALELNLLQMSVAGGELRAIDAEIANNQDVYWLLGKNVAALQCVAIFSTGNCKNRKLIGACKHMNAHPGRGTRCWQDTIVWQTIRPVRAQRERGLDLWPFWQR